MVGHEESEYESLEEKKKFNETVGTDGYSYQDTSLGIVLKTPAPENASIIASTLVLFEKNPNDIGNPYIILVERDGKYRDTGDLLDVKKLPPNKSTAIESACARLTKRTCEVLRAVNKKDYSHVDVPLRDGLVYRCFYTCLEPITSPNLGFLFHTNKKTGKYSSDTTNLMRFSVKNIEKKKSIHPIVHLILKHIDENKRKEAERLPVSFSEQTGIGTMVATSFDRKPMSMTVAGEYHISF